MNPSSKDIQDYLNDLNLGDSSSSSSGSASTGLTFTIYRNEFPPTPNQVTMVRDTGGFDPLLPDYFRPTIQVLVRGNKGGSDKAYHEIQTVVTMLNMKSFSVNSTRYIGVWQMGDILWVGADKEGRPIWSANFRLHRT